MLSVARSLSLPVTLSQVQILTLQAVSIRNINVEAALECLVLPQTAALKVHHPYRQQYVPQEPTLATAAACLSTFPFPLGSP